MQTLTIVTMPEPIRRALALTARGDAVVSMIRLRRKWSGMGADERQAAESAVRQQMDSEDRLWVEPMLVELLAA